MVERLSFSLLSLMRKADQCLNNSLSSRQSWSGLLELQLLKKTLVGPSTRRPSKVSGDGWGWQQEKPEGRLRLRLDQIYLD